MNPMMMELLAQAHQHDRQRELRRIEYLQLNPPAQSRQPRWRQISHGVGGQLVRLGMALQTFGAREQIVAPVQTCETC